MRFRLIDEERAHHPVSHLARVLGVSRAGYHAWKRRPLSARELTDIALKNKIAKIHESSFGIYGAPRKALQL